MLNDELVRNMLSLRDDEDSSLWQQGDILRDNALTKAETKKLAEILQRKPSTLDLRRRVSTETPNDKRNKNYSWSIYALFVRIEDPAIRWQLMFSRTEWTIQSASDAVRHVTQGDPKQSQTLSKAMVIGDILVKGKLENDVLILKVWLGDSYDVDVSQNGRVTSIEFTN